ncbi:MAG: hypothetical protein U5K31_02900 [Balneolaceae bacterium]|nr:hypothetical protein [Balneolaceae bacterium]
MRHNVQHLDLSGDLPLEEIRTLGEKVERQSDPGERLLVLEAMWLVVEADRSTLPGMSMAHFSYLEMERERARRLGYVNGEILLEYIHESRAELVILTDRDWGLFRQRDVAGQVRRGLSKGYRLESSRRILGRGNSLIEIYKRL